MRPARVQATSQRRGSSCAAGLGREMHGSRREPRTRSVAAAYLCGAAAKLCLFAVGGAYLAYLVGINLFLSTALFEMAIDADPKTLDIHFERGWSLRPGRVHAKDLSIRSRDGSVEWMLRIDDVQFDLSFRALAQQRFQVAHVHGVRRLVPAEEPPRPVGGQSRRAWRACRPIDGYPAVPVRPYTPVQRQRVVRRRTITSGRSSSRTSTPRRSKELWINRYRLDGDTSTTGRFYLKPVRAVEVGPLHTEIRGSRVSVGGACVGRGARRHAPTSRCRGSIRG